MRKVFIVNPNNQYISMYLNNGWAMAGGVKDADLVQFTGGEDVNPDLYGEDPHVRTHFNPERDRKEKRIFDLCVSMGKPMAGICRGGQFLNVMCGGEMWQHVTGHAIGGTHGVVDTMTGVLIECTSTHHQMMRPSEDAYLLGVASESHTLERVRNGKVEFVNAKRGDDVEVVYYKEQRALCFQPHPEYLATNSECQQWYFELINQYLRGNV